MRLSTLLSVSIAAFPASLVAQSAKAAATITEADVARRIRIIADDSMGGRDTPSAGLDKTARYIASEFKRLGLKPGGDAGGYLQEYPITKARIAAKASSIAFENGQGPAIRLSFEDNARLVAGSPGVSAQGTVVLIGGPLDSLSRFATELQGKVVVWVTDKPLVGPALFRAFRSLGGIAPAAVAVTVRDDPSWAQLTAAQERGTVTAGVPPSRPRATIVAIREEAVIAQLPEAGDQFAELRGATTLTVHPVPTWTGRLTTQREVIEEAKAPNTIGILEGSDPVLKNQYLVYSAHMDHIGTAGTGSGQCRPSGGDSICNGADDDGSGTVGIVELAEAFVQKGARPKRSVIFLTVSGEEKGLWGSGYFAEHPPVPIGDIVADLNADMIGRNWKDTIVVIGKEHSDLGQTMNSVNARHPELGMNAIDDRWPEEQFYYRSDHFNFAQRGVPILFFFNGSHADYHRATDSPDKLDAEKESRILRLMFYLGEEVANRPARPKWNPESYAKIVAPKKQTP